MPQANAILPASDAAVALASRRVRRNRRRLAADERESDASSRKEAAAPRGRAKATADELAASRATMRATLDATADGILVTDDQGRVTGFNEKFLQIWGFERSEVDGGTHADLARVALPRLRDPVGVTQRVAAIYAAPPASETSDEIELLDGRLIERFSSVQQIGGRAVGRVWSYRDVTAHRAAEEALRDEAGVLHFLNRTGATIAATLDIRELLQTVIDAATQVSGAAFGAFLYRVDPLPTHAAHAFDGLVPGNAQVASSGPLLPPGIPMLALAGITEPPEDLFDPERAAALFGAVWRGDRTVRCDDVTATPRYGATATHFGVAEGYAPVRSFLAVPVTLRDGSTVGGLFFGHPEIGVFTERTERIVVGVAAHAAIALDNARLVERMRRVALERERLVEAERAAREDAARAAQIKDEFLSTLSHELRTPLTAILGWAKVLLLKRADADTQQRGLEAIERNANAQTALIEELLDMSRIVSGKVQLDVQPTDVARVVADAVEAARPAAQAKGLVLEQRIAGEPGIVAGDAARLGQVLASLLSNAIKFTPAQGRIEVAAWRAGEQVEIAVSDTGSGIDPAFVTHVFDRFRQADSSTTRRHGGLGLGLAIVKQLVSMHGGAVSGSSEGAGRGARFVLRLPRAGALAPVTPAPPSADPSAGSFADVDLHGLRLLVVDDENDARELIARLLVECGADVRQAANADEALTEFKRRPPDVLLSDISMPERDGYELIRDVRACDAAHGGDVPAIALTAFVRPEDRAQAMLAGFQAHVGKPIRPEELVESVRRVMKGRSGH